MLYDLWTGGWFTEWTYVVVGGAITAVMAFLGYTGWRNLGVIDQRVWYHYLWLFPLLTIAILGFGLTWVVSLLAGEPPVFDVLGSGSYFYDVVNLLSLFVLSLLFISSFVSLLLLRGMTIHPMGVRLVDLVSGLTKSRSTSWHKLIRLPRKSLGRGLTYAISGAVLIIGASFVKGFPNSQERFDMFLARLAPELNLLGCFLHVRARCYFQVDADSLLAVDKRPPILFLRSFSDDEKHRHPHPDRALLDYSLETRFANHFNKFGPFIAIGSPKEALPQPGAARAILPDDQWQPRVLDWMKEAQVIIMYAGTTEWVSWELRKIAECGRSTDLILMFPQTKLLTSWSRERDVVARIDSVREVYKDSAWEEELSEYRDFTKVRAMLFRIDGSMIILKSRSRGRDAYHLAALIAHYLLLHPASSSTSTVTDVESDGLR